MPAWPTELTNRRHFAKMNKIEGKRRYGLELELELCKSLSIINKYNGPVEYYLDFGC